MPDNFDIDFKLLPPQLKARLWLLALDANTSKVNLTYNPGAFRTSLAYNYGGNAEASLFVRRYSLSASFDPSNQDVNLKAGLVYRGFNFQLSGSPTKPAVSFGVTYGRKLLPFPDQLSSVFNSANGGLMNMASDISAAPNNPLAWYKLHSDDVDTISKAVGVGRQIADQGSKSSDRYGFGMGLGYTQTTGLTISLGLGVFF